MATPESLLYWSERGVVLHGGARVGERTFDRPGLRAIVARWDQVAEVDLADPWPTMAIRLQLQGCSQREQLAIRDEHVDRWVEHMARFVREARRRGIEVEPGWLDREDIDWEQVRHWPARGSRQIGPGVYRAAPLPRDRIIAQARLAPSSRVLLKNAWTASAFGALLGLAAYGPAGALVGGTAGLAFAGELEMLQLMLRTGDVSPQLRDVRAIAVTRDAIYVRSGEEIIYRAPRSALAARVRTIHPRENQTGRSPSGAEHTYILGRRATLTLPVTAAPEVISTLEASLPEHAKRTVTRRAR
jgi:hypothetical protein